MSSAGPRLLVVARERGYLRQGLERRFPDLPFAFVAEVGPEGSPTVEAALVGSIRREAPSWDPSRYPRLRFLQRLFAGVDDLPFDRLPREVGVAGNVGGYAPFVAEHAVALALASARCVVAGQRAVVAGQLRPPPELRSLRGETAVILGYGAIGHAIAERLRPFGTRCLGLNRSGAAAEGVERTFAATQLREAVAAAAFLFDARPLTRATRGTVDAALLGAMREDATYVNVGRAGTVDEAALYRHLKEYPRFRAALDVWWEEDFAAGTLRSRFPFADLPNFVGSPHWAGFAPQVEEFALETALENLRRFFDGQPPAHLVDRREYPP